MEAIRTAFHPSQEARVSTGSTLLPVREQGHDDVT